MALKGSLQFAKHITENLVRKERFYTSHTVYDKDHLANQILYCALELVNKTCRNPTITDRIGRLMLDFPDVSKLNVQKEHFDKLKNDRLLKDYREALSIAKLLLLNFRPDLKHGREDLLAIMFDMNTLWEEYIFRVLQKENVTWSISRQNKKAFWKSDTRTKTIRPDIVLKNKHGDESFVIDTKWKVIDSNSPGDDDLKQMYVYNHYWHAQASILLYPKSGNQNDKIGTYEYGKRKCMLGFVNVLEDGQLSSKIGSDIMEKIAQLLPTVATL